MRVRPIMPVIQILPDFADSRINVCLTILLSIRPRSL